MHQKKTIVELRALDVMSDATTLLQAGMNADEAGQVFKVNRITGAPVIDEEGQVVGVLSVTDLLAYETGVDIGSKHSARLYHMSDLIRTIEPNEKLEVRSLKDAKIEELMTRNFVHAMSHTSLAAVASLMLERKVRRVLIIDGGRLMGIVTHTDVLKAVSRGIGEA